MIIVQIWRRSCCKIPRLVLHGENASTILLLSLVSRAFWSVVNLWFIWLRRERNSLAKFEIRSSREGRRSKGTGWSPRGVPN
jgi:hypothetical protein